VIPRLFRRASAAFSAAVLISSTLGAQNERERDRDDRRSLDIGVNGAGLSIGDSRRWTGLRMNYRDSRLDEVTGVNLTLWYPYENGAGDVGVAAPAAPVPASSIGGIVQNTLITERCPIWQIVNASTSQYR